MNDFGIAVIRAVSLLLANKRLVDLGLQVRLAPGVVGRHYGQRVAKRQRFSAYITYRLDPSLQNTVKQEFATVTSLKQEAVVQFGERDARVIIKLRHVGREVHFDKATRRGNYLKAGSDENDEEIAYATCCVNGGFAMIAKQDMALAPRRLSPC
jgi:hypothetical protein